MTLTNTLAYNNTATCKAVKSFIVQAHAVIFTARNLQMGPKARVLRNTWL